jgi:5'-3' exoribonuclease 1
MNGIIHNCSHGDSDDNAIIVIRTEEEMFMRIFQYIENLFNIAKPKKLLYMAIDGVAPRAKMNQQRSRRFRVAKETRDLVNNLLSKGKKPPSDLFDTNCITPGTQFMAKLSEHIKFYIRKKIKEDPSWRNIKIIYSGHEDPGEGEHKIMDYIRHLKAQPDWDLNQTHCLYGLDADLIMLSLASHEPYFSLLREEGVLVPHRKKGKSSSSGSSGDRAQFHLLHITLLREYLNLEFCSLKK